jgi:hypothetical protein
VDDMFHQETGLDDADDEDDGDGEFLLSLPLFLPLVSGGRWTEFREVPLAFVISSDSSLRGVATQQTGHRFIFPIEERSPSLFSLSIMTLLDTFLSRSRSTLTRLEPS